MKLMKQPRYEQRKNVTEEAHSRSTVNYLGCLKKVLHAQNLTLNSNQLQNSNICSLFRKNKKNKKERKKKKKKKKEKRDLRQTENNLYSSKSKLHYTIS